jgi:hypothetical protein
MSNLRRLDIQLLALSSSAKYVWTYIWGFSVYSCKTASSRKVHLHMQKRHMRQDLVLQKRSSSSSVAQRTRIPRSGGIKRRSEAERGSPFAAVGKPPGRTPQPPRKESSSRGGRHGHRRSGGSAPPSPPRCRRTRRPPRPSATSCSPRRGSKRRPWSPSCRISAAGGGLDLRRFGSRGGFLEEMAGTGQRRCRRAARVRGRGRAATRSLLVFRRRWWWWRCCLPQIRPPPPGPRLVLAGAPPESSVARAGGREERGVRDEAVWMKKRERKRWFPRGCACWEAMLHFAAGFGATAGAASGLPRLQNPVAALVAAAGVSLKRPTIVCLVLIQLLFFSSGCGSPGLN